MARELGFTGFETLQIAGDGLTGDQGRLTTSLRYSTDRPYTGALCGKCLKTGVAASTAVLTLSTAHTAAGTNKYGILATRIRVNTYPSVTNVLMGGFSASGAGGHFQMDTTGHCRVYCQGQVSAYGGVALTLDSWYRLEFHYQIWANFRADNFDQLISTLYIRHDDGTLLETVTTVFELAGTGDTGLQAPRVGAINTDFTCDIDFDDFLYVSDIGTIGAFPNSVLNIPTLPEATRVSPVYPTGQGASAGWMNDWRAVRGIPHDSSNPEQTTATLGASTTFEKPTCAVLGLSGIEAVRVTAAMRCATGSGTDALLWNAVEYPTALTAGWGAYPHLQSGPMSNAAFDAAEFGARNLRGVTISIGTILAQVLHAGSPPDPFEGTGSWQSRVLTWTGTGTWQTLTGVGFEAHVLLWKRVGSSAPGGIWIRRLGGTQSLPLGSILADSLGVMYATPDGFELGPSTLANDAGATYVGVAMQDGGGGAEGRYFDCGSYWGTVIDDRAIALPDPFAPDVVLVFANPLSYRDRDHGVDDQLQFGTGTGTANGIQNFTATGFQVGTLLNGGAILYPWMALRRGTLGRLGRGCEWGSFLAAAGVHTVTGLFFEPLLVIGDAGTAADAAFRSAALHAGVNSGIWNTGAPTVNGVTAITEDGFTVGSTLAIVGETTHWMAFANLVAVRCGSGDVPSAADLVDSEDWAA